MTVKEMSQLYYLNKEIEQLKRQKIDLEYVLNNMSTTQDSVSGSSKCIPFAVHNVHIEGIAPKDNAKWLKCKSDLENTKNLCECKKMQLVYEYNRLNSYIQECEDSLTRQVLSLRYINGLSWLQVALSIGGDNTADGVKQISCRYLKKH